MLIRKIIFLFFLFLNKSNASVEISAFIFTESGKSSINSGECFFTKDKIQFHIKQNSNHNKKFKIQHFEKGSWKTIYSDNLEQKELYYPSQTKSLKFSKNATIEKFRFIDADKVVKKFHFIHLDSNISNIVDQNISDINKDLINTINSSKIFNIDFIDENRLVKKTRDIQDTNIYNALSKLTMVVKTNNSIGTGFIVDNYKHILTNWHIVKNNNIVFIAKKPKFGTTPQRNNFYRSRVIKFDKTKDLALLKIEDNSFFEKLEVRYLTFANIPKINIGEDIYTIGHPSGYCYTFTKGLIRNIFSNHKWKSNLVEHTAKYTLMVQNSISAGSSGGALVNRKLELLGIMTYSDTQGQNMNFAISSEDIKSFITSDNNISEKKQKFVTNFKNIKTIKTIRVLSTHGNYMYLQKIDTTDNGISDIVLLDTDGDLTWDRILYDLDEDGKIEKWVSI